jgi:DNA primase
MARIPDDVIERLKQDISLERVAEARGVKLTRNGADLIGLCPFTTTMNPASSSTQSKTCGIVWGPARPVAPSSTGSCAPKL